MGEDVAPLTQAPKGDSWVSLFDGHSLNGWHTRGTPNDSHLMSWVAVNGVLVNVPPTKDGQHGIDLISDVKLGDHELYIEFMVPQGSNSGVYLIGDYEIQVFDSFGVEKPSKTDGGAIYNKIAPTVNAAKPAGAWQCYHAIFHAPVVKDGVVEKHARVTLFQNGVKVIDNQEIVGLTGAALSAEVVAEGPTYLQGDHGLVLYRNIYCKKLN